MDRHFGKLRLFLGRTRLLGWWHMLLLPAAGWLLASQVEVWRLVLALLAGAGLLSAAYAHNDHHDLGRGTHRLWHLLPLLAAAPLVVMLSPAARVGALLFVVTAALYSGPPRLKAVPLVGTLLNALGFPMLCLLGVAEMNRAAWSLVGLTGLWMASAQLVHEAAHQAQDRAAGLRTSASVLGPLVSARVSLALLLMAAPVARGISPAAAVGMAIYAMAVGLLASGLRPGHLRLAMRYLGLGWALLVGADLLSRAGW